MNQIGPTVPGVQEKRGHVPAVQKMFALLGLRRHDAAFPAPACPAGCCCIHPHFLRVPSAFLARRPPQLRNIPL